MAPIAGRPLIERTWEVACAAPGAARVIVATDCQTIAAHIAQLGGEVFVDDVPYANGTERVAAVAVRLPADIEVVVNLQGDAPLTPPDVVAAVAGAVGRGAADAPLTPHPAAHIATAACALDHEGRAQLEQRRAHGEASGTLVVTDRRGRALYFSRAMIPWERTVVPRGPRALRHIGIYGFMRATLPALTHLSPTPLEAAEGLEQLRWLEHGWAIDVAVVQLEGRTLWSVDHPSDVEMAETLLEREGEPVAGYSTARPGA